MAERNAIVRRLRRATGVTRGEIARASQSAFDSLREMADAIPMRPATIYAEARAAELLHRVGENPSDFADQTTHLDLVRRGAPVAQWKTFVSWIREQAPSVGTVRTAVRDRRIPGAVAAPHEGRDPEPGAEHRIEAEQRRRRIERLCLTFLDALLDAERDVRVRAVRAVAESSSGLRAKLADIAKLLAAPPSAVWDEAAFLPYALARLREPGPAHAFETLERFSCPPVWAAAMIRHLDADVRRMGWETLKRWRAGRWAAQILAASHYVAVEDQMLRAARSIQESIGWSGVGEVQPAASLVSEFREARKALRRRRPELDRYPFWLCCGF